jgi:hypothetical protein
MGAGAGAGAGVDVVVMSVVMFVVFNVLAIYNIELYIELRTFFHFNFLFYKIL